MTEEGLNPKLQSSIPKCPHGVYSPLGDTSYCTVCSSPKLEPKSEKDKKEWENKLHAEGLDPITTRQIISPRKEKDVIINNNKR